MPGDNQLIMPLLEIGAVSTSTLTELDIFVIYQLKNYSDVFTSPKAFPVFGNGSSFNYQGLFPSWNISLQLGLWLPNKSELYAVAPAME